MPYQYLNQVATTSAVGRRGLRQFLVSGHYRHNAEAIVGDALVASRPRDRRRCWPDAGDHKGRPDEAVPPNQAAWMPAD